MKLFNNSSRFAVAVVIALAVAIPAIGQDSPESILPPGFGDPADQPDKPASDRDGPRKKPTTAVPNLDIDLPSVDDDGDVMASDTSSSAPRRKPSGAAIALPGGLSATLGQVDGVESDGQDQEADGELRRVGQMDLPAQAQRSTAVVGLLGTDDGDLGLTSFTGYQGRFLSNVMRKTRAPIASRWSSILLRRALLSQSATPSDVDGADWVAERAWLLLRMGEADSARMLVQAVDTNKYTPKMLQVAMQAALATGDPSGMCPMAEQGEKVFTEASWSIARGVCSGLSGETAHGNAMIDRVRDKRRARGIDVLLAEKIIGAGANTRRAIMIQWDDVKQLTAWRYGLASATGVIIPQRLMTTVGPQVQAWQARSPLVALGDRVGPAEQAAAMGVFSASALVDLYSFWYDASDPAERAGKPFQRLRNAYVGRTAAERLGAIKSLWDDPKLNDTGRYARLILTARAAARLKPDAAFAADSDRIIASMLAAGLDTSAARWASVASSGSDTIRGWGLLAVGAPDKAVEISAGLVDDYRDAAGAEGLRRAQFLFAGLAGLGRIPVDDIENLAEDFEVPVGRKSKWTQALDRAVDVNAKASVALLCAAGLQARDWSKIPPAHLYRVVSALRRVGLTSEARMIAAEALMRS
jgi:hypothetical protein